MAAQNESENMVDKATEKAIKVYEDTLLTPTVVSAFILEDGAVSM